jgi:hypothetical protein
MLVKPHRANTAAQEGVQPSVPPPPQTHSPAHTGRCKERRWKPPASWNMCAVHKDSSDMFVCIIEK